MESELWGLTDNLDSQVPPQWSVHLWSRTCLRVTGQEMVTGWRSKSISYGGIGVKNLDRVNG